MAYHRNAIREKTRQGGDVLYAFAFAVIAICAVVIFGEPFWVTQLGSGVPWWAYAVLFIPFVLAFARVITDDTLIQNANRGNTARERGGLREPGDFEESGLPGMTAPNTRPQFDFVASEIH